MSTLEKILVSSNARKMFQVMAHDSTCVLVDAKNNILEYSDKFAKLVDESHLIGLPLRLLKYSINYLGNEMQEQLLDLRHKKRSSQWFIIGKHPLSSDVRLFEVNDYPLFCRRQVTGSFIQFKELNFTDCNYLQQFVEILMAKNNQPSRRAGEQKLSALEQEITFLLVLGKSPKEIALLLEKITARQISHASIASIINKRIYNKLNVSSVSSAITSLLLSDELKTIPASLLKNAKKYYFIKDYYNYLEL